MQLLSRLARRSFTLLQIHSRRCLSKEAFENYEAENEPLLHYGPGSPERAKLDAALKKYQAQTWEVPIVIGDEEIETSDVWYQVYPFDHQKKLARFHYATPDLLRRAIDNCLEARNDWDNTPIHERATVFLKAAELMTEKYRYDLLATTMLGQGKNTWQAEIDAAAEMIDFLRFNVMYASQMLVYQPISPDPQNINRMIYRGMEGFWAAIAPFNFTAIGGHLPTAPALMGNVALWKPSDTAVLSNYTVYKILREAGLPPGVINFVPADGPVFGEAITGSPHLAGINFTGSVPTFTHLMKQTAQHIGLYKSYPRLIGECGGKNFHFVHPSADVVSVVHGTIRSAFEYNGQKCSACSRMYIPESIWPKIKEGLLKIHKEIQVGSPLEKNSFVTAVIDDRAFKRIKSYIDYARTANNVEIIAGGKCDDSKGYFIEPTIIETLNPHDKLMKEELFGPVIAVHVYPDDKWREEAEMAESTSPFGLTGAIFAENEDAKEELVDIFRHSAGNLYINNKSTGSVVGQQPFGGARLSGTNDKAGGPFYLMKFVSIQSLHECEERLTEWRYPSMDE